MSTFGFISDIHCHNFEPFSTALPSGRNSRFADVLWVINEFEAECLARKVDGIFVLGDIFHSRSKIDTDVYSSTYRAFQYLAEGAPLFILIGNHDQSNRVGSVHSLVPFTAFATVIDQPTIQQFKDITFAAIPHTVDKEEFRNFSKSIKSVDLFLAHQALKEGTVGPNDHCPKNGISVDDLPHERAKLCLLGDYHNAQKLKHNVMYLGSPYQLDFGERNAKKGFWFLDTDDWQMEFVESHAPTFQVYDGVAVFDAAVFDSDKDFVRVFVHTEEEAERVRNHYPRVEVILQEVAVEANQRVSTDIVNDDSKLVKEFIHQHAAGLDKDKATETAMQLLNGEE